MAPHRDIGVRGSAGRFATLFARGPLLARLLLLSALLSPAGRLAGPAAAQMPPTIPTPPPLTVPTLPDTPQAATPEPQAEAAAPRIHRDSSGKWVPDAGCHWLDDDPDDLRVQCGN
jgi:hypothetical protein